MYLEYARNLAFPPRVILRVRWCISLVSTLVTASRFLVGNIEGEVKPSSFSSLLLLRVFLVFLFGFSYIKVKAPREGRCTRTVGY